MSASGVKDPGVHGLGMEEPGLEEPHDGAVPGRLRARGGLRTAPDVWDFVTGGSGDESTLDANRTALDRVRVVSRVLRDVSRVTTDASLLGRRADLPVAVAPIAYHRLVHPDGEFATARAAKAAGVPFTVSTLSSVPIEAITQVGGRSGSSSTGCGTPNSPWTWSAGPRTPGAGPSS